MLTELLNGKGKFFVEHVRNGKILERFEVKNTIVNEGKNACLNIMFHASTQITTWYLGLIDNSGFSAIAATDTHASHAGWSENTDYAEATREEWAEDAASSQSITNTTLAEFSINATASIRGGFLSSVSTKGDTGAGTLWAAVDFGSPRSVADGDTLRLTYTVTFS